jgi:hypothetical protein
MPPRGARTKASQSQSSGIHWASLVSLLRWLLMKVGVVQGSCYKLHIVLDAAPRRLLSLCVGALHHLLQGDLGVLTAEAQQPMLHHNLRQDTALCL